MKLKINWKILITFSSKYFQVNKIINILTKILETKLGIFSILVPKARLLSSTGGPLEVSSLLETAVVEKGGKIFLTCSSPMRIGFSAFEHIAKKFSGKNYKKKHFWSPMQKTKVTQIKRSTFADQNEPVEQINFELELIKTPEWFLFDKSIHTSNLKV